MEKTFYPKGKQEGNWILVDAKEQNLGRLATQIATYLLGKHKPIYTPGVDAGDFVVVVNAKRVNIYPTRLTQKIYYRHSGYPGGLKSINLRDQLQSHPDRVIRAAVWGMLPHNKLGRRLIKKLRIYPEDSHPHGGQSPQSITKIEELLIKGTGIGLGSDKETVKIAEKRSVKEADNTTDEIARKKTDKVTGKERGRAAQKSTGKEISKVTKKGTAKGTGRATKKSTVKVISKAAQKGTAKETSKAAQKGAAKETSKVIKKGTAKGTTGRATKKATSKEPGRGSAKKTEKRTGKEAGKGVEK